MVDALNWNAIDDYLTLLRQAKRAECEYFYNYCGRFDHNNLRIWSPFDDFPLRRQIQMELLWETEYKRYFDLFSSGNHEFEIWLQTNSGYNSAFNKFRKKDIFFPVSDCEKEKIIPPLYIETIFNGMIAESLMFYKEAIDSNGKMFTPPYKKIDEIENDAHSLLEKIESEPYFHANAPHLRRLKNLLKDFYVIKPRPYPYKVIQFNLYSANKYYPKWPRELFIRNLALNYGETFGRWIGSKEIPAKMPRKCIHRAYRDGYKISPKFTLAYSYLHERNKLKIHCDVLTDIVSIIDPDISERKVFRIVEKARDIFKKIDDDICKFYHDRKDVRNSQM